MTCLAISHASTDTRSVGGWCVWCAVIGFQSCLHRHRVGGELVCVVRGDWFPIMPPPTQGRWWAGAYDARDMVSSYTPTDPASVDKGLKTRLNLHPPNRPHRHRVGGGLGCVGGHGVWFPIMPPPTQGRWGAGVCGGHGAWFPIMPPPTQGRWWAGVCGGARCLVSNHASTDTGSVVGCEHARRRRTDY